MRHVDFSPLYRSTVGFDRLFSMLDGLGQPEQANPTRRIISSGQVKTPIASPWPLPVSMKPNSASNPVPIR